MTPLLISLAVAVALMYFYAVGRSLVTSAIEIKKGDCDA
jgi:hypothetical protein